MFFANKALLLDRTGSKQRVRSAFIEGPVWLVAKLTISALSVETWNHLLQMKMESVARPAVAVFS